MLTSQCAIHVVSNVGRAFLFDVLEVDELVVLRGRGVFVFEERQGGDGGIRVVGV